MGLEQTQEKVNVREGIVHSAIPPEELARLSDDIIAALKTVYDPKYRRTSSNSVSSTRSISKTTGW